MSKIDYYAELSRRIPEKLEERGCNILNRLNGNENRLGWLRGSCYFDCNTAGYKNVVEFKVTYTRPVREIEAENKLLPEGNNVIKTSKDLLLDAIGRFRESREALRNFMQLVPGENLKIMYKEAREQLPVELQNLQTECLDRLKEMMSTMLENRLCEVEINHFFEDEMIDSVIGQLELLSPVELMAFMDNAMNEIDKFYEARDGIDAGLNDMWMKSKDLLVFLQKTNAVLLESHRDNIISNAVVRIFHGYQVMQNAKNQNGLEHSQLNILT